VHLIKIYSTLICDITIAIIPKKSCQSCCSLTIAQPLEAWHGRINNFVSPWKKLPVSYFSHNYKASSSSSSSSLPLTSIYLNTSPYPHPTVFMAWCLGIGDNFTLSFTCIVWGEWSAPCSGCFTPRARAPCTQWIGGWVSPRDSLDMAVKRIIPSPSGIEPCSSST